MAEIQRGNLFAPACKVWIEADHEPARSQLDQLCETPIEVMFGAGIQDIELQPKGASRCLQLLRVGLGNCRIGWIDEQSNGARRGD